MISSIDTFLLGVLQSIAALTIAANLAYLNIQGLKYADRIKQMIRARLRDHLPIMSIPEDRRNDERYHRIFKYGDLTNVVPAGNEPLSKYSGSVKEGFLYHIFMRPLGAKFPITIDKLTCASVLTFTVILLLYITFSFAIGDNYFLNIIGDKPANSAASDERFSTFYIWYASAIWIFPIGAAILYSMVYVWDAIFINSGEKFRPLLFIMAAVLMIIFLIFIYPKIMDFIRVQESISSYWLRTWIFGCGALLFVPTYFVMFASLVYPGIEREVERDIASLIPTSSQASDGADGSQGVEEEEGQGG